MPDVRMPDGTIIRNVPANATKADIQARYERARQAGAIDAPNDSRLTGFIGGAIKPVDNLVRGAANVIPGFDAVDRFGQSLGFPAARDAVANNNAMRQNNTRTGYQALGNIAGTLPTAYLPGGLFTQGGVSGALLSNADTAGGVAADTLLGGVTSKGIGMALKGAGAVIAPKFSAGTRRLADAGVLMTPGQMMSGAKSGVARGLSKMEEAATSVPLLGDAISMAREHGSESLNRALANRALGNIGARVPSRVPVGDMMNDYVGQRLGRAYDKLVPQLHATFDQQFANDLGAAATSVAPLPKAAQTKFSKILDDVFTNRSNGTFIAGDNLKAAETQLTKWIKTYAGRGGDDEALADALKMTRQALRDSVGRSNPQHAAELAALNKGWAQAKVLRTAGEATPDGISSPQRLFQESRKTGYRDPLIRTANARLRNTTPDSGTARRGMAAMAGNAVLSGTLGATVNPALAIPALLSGAYTKKGMQAINKMAFSKRGPIAQGAGKALREVGDYSASLAAGLRALIYGEPNK